MIYIGIVIFTVYTKTIAYVGDCEPHFSTGTLCADIVKSTRREEGRLVPQYVGEFKSDDECRMATQKVHYTAKDDERVDDVTEILCVPKNSR